MIKLRPDKGLEYYISDYLSGERNSRREFTGGPEGVIKPAKTARDVIERYFVANRAMFNVHQRMKTHINNAEKLGLSQGDIGGIFKKRGIRKDYNYLDAGIFSPYFPSKDVQNKFYEIADQTGLANPFEQALPILTDMYNAFSRQSLNDTFEYKLEDFLPKPQPEIDTQQQPLQTPMPSGNIILGQSQPMTTDQGLTPTEMALLSPEEQQIRLRQRGLTS